MSFWNILNWVLVVALTGINIFIFLKLKAVSEQVLKSMFPGAKNTNDALAKMNDMMKMMPSMMGMMGGKTGTPNMDSKQLDAAMKLLSKFQQNQKNS
jgi:hypothetical protein